VDVLEEEFTEFNQRKVTGFLFYLVSDVIYIKHS